MAPQIGVPPAAMIAAHDIVCSVMGSAWIERQAERLDVRARSIADVHPLFRSLTGGTELNIIEVCELAAYCVAFKTDARLGEAIISLRDPNKYAATVTELSMAWKFKLAGASVRLAPPTERGTADFAAEVAGKEHVVEVSGFPNDPFRSDSMIFVGAMQTALKSALKRHAFARHVVVEIEVEGSDVENLQAEAHRAIASATQEFAKLGTQSAVAHEYPFGSVKVRLVVPGEKPDTLYWTCAVCLTLVPPPDTGLLTMEHLTQGQETHWLYVRLPERPAYPYERIKQKLKTEARQLRGCTDAVVMLDSGGLRMGIPSDGDSHLSRIAKDFEREHASTTAFGVIAQPVKRDGTSGLAGAYFALAPGALSAAFWRDMLKADQQSTVLWELDELRK